MIIRGLVCLVAGLAQGVLQGSDMLEAVAGYPLSLWSAVTKRMAGYGHVACSWKLLWSGEIFRRLSNCSATLRHCCRSVTSYFWNLSRSITPTLATLVLHQPLACHLKLVFWRNILFLSEMSIPESLKAVLEVVQSACIGPGLSVLSSYN